MELLPEWAPNAHPMLVHFPIALLVGAIGADLLGLLVRKWDWLPPATVALYVAGALSAVATYFTGTWAADAVSVPPAAEALLTEHSNLGWWTMWFFVVYAVIRLGSHLWPMTRGQIGIRALLFLVALGGGYLLYQTGDHGAEMVFRYGLGVQGVEPQTSSVEPGVTIGETGWQWKPQSDTAWTRRVTWLEGQPSDVETTLDTTGAGRIALRLRPQAPITFVVPDTLEDVRVTAELNRDAFDGAVSLVHHVQGPKAYDYLTLDRTAVRQGRLIDGEQTTFATGTAEGGGWQEIRAVGDGAHFRGYVNGNMVVHGHGDPASAGPVGLRLDGTGTVLLRDLLAVSL